ncbi:MAG TPA: radical SAM family heme chaperone HemW [Desulfonatronum sp.]|nr:radical SAM family heme chaperone HemW [Desulfonatronum sp.]
MLLYIHVPFCRSKCAYCSFFSLPLSDQLSLNAYLNLLLKEIAFWGRRLGSVPVSSLYFGGGTPSLLSLAGLERIIRALDTAFSLQPGLECSLEANPDSCEDPEYLRGLKSLGVNRLSLGLQSLDNAQLRRLERRHDAAQGVRVFDLARWAGFENINLDLIWGLPGQCLRSWLQTLDKTLSLQPEHIACYGLSIEGDTPLAQTVVSGETTLPAEDVQAKMFLRGAEMLESRGFLQYEISNFSRMGYACRHNQGYWDGVEYLGLGAGAVSTLGGRRWENPKNLNQYARLVRWERLGENAQELTPSERVKELIMLSLRTACGLELKAYTRAAGKTFLREHARLIQVLRQNELIRISEGRLRLTKAGMLVSNSILEHFFPATQAP